VGLFNIDGGSYGTTNNKVAHLKKIDGFVHNVVDVERRKELATSSFLLVNSHTSDKRGCCLHAICCLEDNNMLFFVICKFNLAVSHHVKIVCLQLG